jgi:hypothetical protein
VHLLRTTVALLAVSLLYLSSSGCSQSDNGYVSGIVTLDGKPAGPGTIRFYAANSTDEFARTPVGSIGEDGHYELLVSRTEKGLEPGEYQVAITDKATEMGSKPKPGSVVIPVRYHTPKESKLTASVKPGTQTIDFTLEP